MVVKRYKHPQQWTVFPLSYSRSGAVHKVGLVLTIWYPSLSTFSLFHPFHSEKDIMIFSCVRAPEEGSAQDSGHRGGIGFMNDWRRLNVAITRAKYAMWIVGHAGELKQSDEWRELINDSRRRGAFIDPSSTPNSGRNCNNGSFSADTSGNTWAVPQVYDPSTNGGAPPSESRFERSNGWARQGASSDYTRRTAGAPPPPPAASEASSASGDSTRRHMYPGHGPAPAPAPGIRCGTGDSGRGPRGHQGQFVGEAQVRGRLEYARPQQPLLPTQNVHLDPAGGHRAFVYPTSLPPLPPPPPLPPACGPPFAENPG